MRGEEYSQRKREGLTKRKQEKQASDLKSLFARLDVNIWVVLDHFSRKELEDIDLELKRVAGQQLDSSRNPYLNHLSTSQAPKNVP